MELSRRSFLGGALAITAATALPASAFASAPIIYGDGAHDDTAGLQAALDGKPFRVAGEGAYIVRREGTIFIGKGSFRLSDTLHLRGSTKATLSGFYMEWSSLPDAAPCIQVSSEGHTLINGRIRGPKGHWPLSDVGWSVAPHDQHVGILVTAHG